MAVITESRCESRALPANGMKLPARIESLRDRALNEEWGEMADRAAMVEAVFEANRREPRKLQIARALEAVCEQMPVRIAEDELIIGKRTVRGYPEHDEAVAAGSAEPGYMIADYPRAINEGFVAIVEDLGRRLGDYDEAHPAHIEHIDSLRAMIVCCEAVLRLAERHAEAAEELAADCGNEERKRELVELARICRKVPAYPAESFHEAVQSFWLTHLGVYLECESVAFSLGRMDQYLYPFYEADVEAGRISREGALELIECLWVKIYENVHGQIGHVQTLTVGGITLDGQDGVNELTYVMQQASRELQNVGPSVASRIYSGTPDEYLRYILETLHMGRYMPQVYNDEQMVPALMSKGVPLEDAREYGLIGCHEPTICGKGYFRSASWPGYVCFEEWLELALGNGRTLDTGEKRGPQTGEPEQLGSFSDLYDAFVMQMAHGVRRSVTTASRGEVVKRTMTPRPMMSALTRGCAEKAMDFTEGGALYNMSGFQAFGIGTCADSLAAIRKLVFEEAQLSLGEFVEILRNNWESHEELRMRVKRSALHFGNDLDEVDTLAARIVKSLEEQIGKYRNIRGGPFILGLWSFWQHVYRGQETAASADGRKHGEMLSHSMGPTAGTALGGPTAAIRSSAKIDTSGLANGGSLMLEFQPRVLGSAAGIAGVISLIRTYFMLGRIQLQLSAVTAEEVQAAVADPDSYRHLVVRVAGYCDYFTRQAPERQAFIIAREKHGLS
jgi:pyruvate formate-lyase/glycerol dehydratase family glycyl radical enzyme